MFGQLVWDGVVLPISDVTWQNVLDTAYKLQGLEVNDDFFVTYKDDDGDVINVKNEIDLSEAIRWAEDQGVPCLCLNVPFSSADSDSDESWTEVETGSPRTKTQVSTGLDDMENRPLVEEEDRETPVLEQVLDVTKSTEPPQDPDNQNVGFETDPQLEVKSEKGDIASMVYAAPVEFESSLESSLELDDESDDDSPQVPESFMIEKPKQELEEHSKVGTSSFAADETPSQTILTPIKAAFNEVQLESSSVGSPKKSDSQGIDKIDKIIEIMCAVNDSAVAFGEDDKSFFLRLFSDPSNVEYILKFLNHPALRSSLSSIARAEMKQPGTAQKAATTHLIKNLYQHPDVLEIVNNMPELEQILLRSLRGLKLSESFTSSFHVVSEDVKAEVKTSPPALVSSIVHPFVTCDGCGSDDDLKANSVTEGFRNVKGEIVGVRYKSAVMPDYDLCQGCEASRRFQSKAGPFIKLVDPDQAPELILCAMPGATAGMMSQLENMDWRNPVAREFFDFVKDRQQRAFAQQQTVRGDRCAPPTVSSVANSQQGTADETGSGKATDHLQATKPQIKCTHTLQTFEAPHGNFRCDICLRIQPVRAVLHGCRLCNFDVCNGCFGKQDVSTAALPTLPIVAVPPQSKFIADVTLADGCTVRPGEQLNKTWRVRNTGPERWPIGTRIAHVGGDSLGGPLQGVAVPLALPNDAVNITVPLVMPTQPGRYTSHWRLMTPHPENAKFGHRFWVTVNVLPSVAPILTPMLPPHPPFHSLRMPGSPLTPPRAPSVVMRPPPPPPPAPRPLAPFVDDFEIPSQYVDSITQIVDLGFTDIEKVLRMLKEVNGDTAAAIERLLEEN